MSFHLARGTRLRYSPIRLPAQTKRSPPLLPLLRQSTTRRATSSTNPSPTNPPFTNSTRSFIRSVFFITIGATLSYANAKYQTHKSLKTPNTNPVVSPLPTTTPTPPSLDRASDYFLSSSSPASTSDTHPLVRFPPPLTDTEVTELLSKEAFVQDVGDVEGLREYHGTRVESNSPCEDGWVHGKFRVVGEGKEKTKDERNWMAWGVFDGHAGWETSALLTQHLVPHIQKDLETLSISAATSPTEIQSALKKSFLSLDSLILSPAATLLRSTPPQLSFSETVSHLVNGYAGSCALLSLFDPGTRTLHVACVGDSRAVLGIQDPNTKSWDTIPLSADQTPRNPLERERLLREHPGEPEEEMLKGDRVLGIMVSRAFGDGRWKWDEETQKLAKEKYGGPSVRPGFKTPPYLTAEPEVTSTKIPTDRRSFLIMASDGLWDTMSSEEAVSLVAMWIDRQEHHASGDAVPPSNDPGNKAQYEPFDLSPHQDSAVRFSEDEVTFQDKNAAVHLARNALGGNHHEKIKGMLTFRPGRARNVRDDITVQVVMFEGGRD